MTGKHAQTHERTDTKDNKLSEAVVISNETCVQTMFRQKYICCLVEFLYMKFVYFSPLQWPVSLSLIVNLRNWKSAMFRWWVGLGGDQLLMSQEHL